MPRPPKYRPPIPMPVKGQVLIRQEGKCGCGCGHKLQHWKDTQFDHDPALALRPWSDKEEDTIPAANDPEHIVALRKDCHARKTNGAGTATTKGSDVHEFHRGRRLSRAHAKHQEKMLKKSGLAGLSADTVILDESDEIEQHESRKPRWPSRPFPANRGSRWKAKIGGGMVPRKPVEGRE